MLQGKTQQNRWRATEKFEAYSRNFGAELSQTQWQESRFEREERPEGSFASSYGICLFSEQAKGRQRLTEGKRQLCESNNAAEALSSFFSSLSLSPLFSFRSATCTESSSEGFEWWWAAEICYCLHCASSARCLYVWWTFILSGCPAETQSCSLYSFSPTRHKVRFDSVISAQDCHN